MLSNYVSMYAYIFNFENLFIMITLVVNNFIYSVSKFVYFFSIFSSLTVDYQSYH